MSTTPNDTTKELEKLRAENQFMCAQIEEMSKVMPCHHSQRWLVTKRHTQYCALCELDKMTDNFLGTQ